MDHTLRGVFGHRISSLESIQLVTGPGLFGRHQHHLIEAGRIAFHADRFGISAKSGGIYSSRIVAVSASGSHSVWQSIFSLCSGLALAFAQAEELHEPVGWRHDSWGQWSGRVRSISMH